MNENNVILTLQLGVAWAIKVVHRDSPQSCAWRLTLGSVPDGSRQCQTSMVTPAKPGDFSFLFNSRL